MSRQGSSKLQLGCLHEWNNETKTRNTKTGADLTGNKECALFGDTEVTVKLSKISSRLLIIGEKVSSSTSRGQLMGEAEVDGMQSPSFLHQRHCRQRCPQAEGQIVRLGASARRPLTAEKGTPRRRGRGEGTRRAAGEGAVGVAAPGQPGPSLPPPSPPAGGRAGTSAAPPAPGETRGPSSRRCNPPPRPDPRTRLGQGNCGAARSAGEEGNRFPNFWDKNQRSLQMLQSRECESGNALSLHRAGAEAGSEQGDQAKWLRSRDNFATKAAGDRAAASPGAAVAARRGQGGPCRAERAGGERGRGAACVSPAQGGALRPEHRPRGHRLPQRPRGAEGTAAEPGKEGRRPPGASRTLSSSLSRLVDLSMEQN
ncbi:collagen alpha-1(I) chain-like [Nycticebus coucang]|uniref:collagen alpha-1(I) chain-like n=1 Tax=Nycticebus coucang TaxID=9470 RepID=UPI00234D94CA|nr:collagen alpha-1(I) chain-like [Nycticebus coucang]